MSAPTRPDRRYAPDFLQELFANPLDPGYADAAARRAEHGSRPPWASRSAYALKLLALLVVGFLFAIAYREAVATEPDRSRAHAGLVDEVRAAQVRSDDLQARSDELLRELTAAQQAALGATAEELARVREQQAAAGLNAVTGDGAVVRLTDAPVPIDPTTGKATGADVSRVLDVDLQSVVNGLWAAGAEAISVNGQRLTAVSTIRTAGSAILVDFRPVTSPYVVNAIGPDVLDRRFDSSPPAAAMRDLANQYGLGFSVRGQDDLTLPAAPGRSLRYAHPVGSPSPTGGAR
jgi:uncharacterized protein YlxW (UPF0749 family)